MLWNGAEMPTGTPMEASSPAVKLPTFTPAVNLVKAACGAAPACGERRSWTLAEDQTILHGIKAHGPKYKRIAQDLPGRTPSSVRNRYQRLIIWAHESDLETSRRTRDGTIGVTVAASTRASH